MLPSFIKHKTIRHYHEPGDLHELTFSCYQRLPLLTNDSWRELLADSINKSLTSHQLSLSAYVFMPEHVHLLVWPTDPKHAEIGSFLKTLKQSCSTKIKHQLVQLRSPLLNRLTVQERPGKVVFRFWQEGPGYDRNLQTTKSVQAAIDYIHNNPVKRGLCGQALEWEWSSARHYVPHDFPHANFPARAAPHWTPLPAEFFT